jgi:hypothetical protein
MPHEVRYDQHHPAGKNAAERIHSRLKSSAGHGHASVETHPNRTVTTVHHGGQQHAQPQGVPPIFDPNTALKNGGVR